MILKQDINLYQTIQPSLPHLSLQRMVSIWLAFLLIIIFFGLQQQSVVEKLQKENENLKRLYHQALSEDKISDKNGLKLLQEKIENSKITVNLLKEIPFRKTSYLSEVLQTFAEKHVKGTFLSQIHISHSNNKMIFHGIALEPKLVPIMIQSWQATPVMESVQFKVLKMQRISPNHSWVSFDLQGE